MKISKFLSTATQQLLSVSDSPHLDAELLVRNVLRVERSYLYTHLEDFLTEQQQAGLASQIARRLSGEPIAYITGQKEFWSMLLNVTPDTLIPRPDTETLVDTILQLDVPCASKVADLGTGSGAIALALAKEQSNWQLVATDISESALVVARKNAHQLGLPNISFFCGDWCTVLPYNDFHIIVSNPPYIGEDEWPVYARGLQFEPRQALVSGKEGMGAIQVIAEQAKNYLAPSGYLLFEHGYQQAEAVRKVLVANGYVNIHSVVDLAGNQRVTYGQKIAPTSQ